MAQFYSSLSHILLWGIFIFSFQVSFSQEPLSVDQRDISQPNARKKAKKHRQTLRFTKNIGQMDESVLYHVNDLQVDHYFLSNEIRTVLTKANSAPEVDERNQADRAEKRRGPRLGQKERENETRTTSSSYSYGLTFLGTEGPEEVMDLQAEIVRTVGKKNYIKGRGRFTDIPQYGQIQYKSLWKGIDVDFYAQKGQLKYDFVVAPFADPSQIRFVMNGVDEVYVDEQSGELVFSTVLGELRKGLPYTYQVIEGQSKVIKSKYTIKDGVISFELADYDEQIPLIIDPVALKFATFLGGNGDDWVYDIYVHPTSKKIYLTGITNSSSFPGVVGTAVSNTANYDGFITCMSRDGSSVLWTTILGGDEDIESLYKIHVSDDENDIFVTGRTRSDDYPTDGLLSPYAANLAGINNPVISRLSGDGSTLKYSTYFPVSSYALERFTVVGDIVYGATYYDAGDASNYPITMPAGAYISTPPSENGHDGLIIFGINTALSGAESFQYGTFFYDTTASAYSYLEFSDSDVDGDGNLYFGGYLDIGEPTYGPLNLFPNGGIQTVEELHTALTSDGYYSDVGWLAQFDSTLSTLMYATPFAPLVHPENIEVSMGDYVFNLEVMDNGDIYTSHPDVIDNIVDMNDITVAPAAKYSNLQALKLNSNDLLLHTATKIAATNRTQFEYIITAPGDYTKPEPAPGAKVDSEGRLHWVFSKTDDDVELDALATEGALQSTINANRDQSQYVILSPSGDLEYATVIGANVNFAGGSMDSYAHACFIDNDGTFYVAGMVERDAQQSFPVTPSYWDTVSASQVFVYDASPASNKEAWLAVFHEPRPTSNLIQDFTSGNDTFCINGMIYQDPNHGPILGDPLSFQSGDGSVANHVLPDIRPGAFGESHPDPKGLNAIHWEISRDNGSTWTTLSNSSSEIYRPNPEIAAGTVMYRRVYSYGSSHTPDYSNVATAEIVENLNLDLQAPSEPIYFCPGTVEDFTFTISGATGNISWQWYDGFAPVDNSVINPASGTDVPANFLATIPSGASQGGYYRLVVEDGTGCAAEVSITTRPLSEDAGSSATLAICPGDVSNEVTIGPSTPNPDFDYSWTGPSGFSSSLSNPTVSIVGTYYLQVRQTGTASFCSGGETSVEILPMTAHDSVLKDTSISLAFCQGDAPVSIGLSGPTPFGYSFQWAPGTNIEDVTAYNPTYTPTSLGFDSPVSTIDYIFSAIRLSDGCVFEDTINVTLTKLAQARAGQDRDVICVDSFAVGGASTGTYFQWSAIQTNYSGGLGALTSDPDFTIDGATGNSGTNKYASIGFPSPSSGSYYIDFEVQSSYVALPNSCFDRDTMRLTIHPCNPGPETYCPDISSTNTAGTGGICDDGNNQLSVTEISGASYEWTTYAVDGVVQAAGTDPRGLFEVGGSALTSSGPHPTQVGTDLSNATWGWVGAYYVEYQITLSIYINATLYTCSDRIVVYSSIVGNPVVDVNNIDVCEVSSPGTLLTGNGINLPYLLSGSDYNTAPNSLLAWTWTNGPIDSNGDTPFPTLNPTATTDYYVTARDTLTGCIAVDTFVVNMRSIIADAGSDFTTACTGAVVQLGSSAKTNHSYQWSPSSGLNFPIGTPNSTVAQPYLTVPATASSYSLIATESTTGCQATDTVLITPGSTTPSAPTAASYTSCPDGELTIGPLYSPSTGIQFSWTAGSGANISWLDNTTVNQPTVILPSSFSGSATFTLTVSNGSCGTASTDYTITNTSADVELGADVTAVCQAPYIQIGSASQTSGFIYLWQPSEGLYTNSTGTAPYGTSNTNSVYARPITATTYTLVARDTATGCIFTDQITVNPPASVDVDAGIDQTLCPGQSSVSIGQGGSGTISWRATGYNSDPTSTPATPSTADSTNMMGYLSATASLPVDFSQITYSTGVYEYEVMADYGGGCIATDEVIVTVPSITTGLAGNPKSLCDGDSVQLGTTAVAGISYVWSILDETAQSGSISDLTSATPFVNPEDTTSYSLIYTDGMTGCEVAETVSVMVIPKPDLNEASIGAFCEPIASQDLTAQISAYGSLASATWYIDYEGGSIESTPTAVQPSRSTEYYVRGYNSNGCSDLGKVTVSVEGPQTPSILTETHVDCSTGTLDLTDYQGSLSDNSFSFEWHSDNSTDSGTILGSSVVGTGTYYLFEKSPAGCYSSSDSIVISACPTSDPCNAAASGNMDTDGDGLSGFCDLDDDNDGLSDQVECAGISENFPATVSQLTGTGTQSDAEVGDVYLLDNAFVRDDGVYYDLRIEIMATYLTTVGEVGVQASGNVAIRCESDQHNWGHFKYTIVEDNSATVASPAGTAASFSGELTCKDLDSNDGQDFTEVFGISGSTPANSTTFYNGTRLEYSLSGFVSGGPGGSWSYYRLDPATNGNTSDWADEESVGIEEQSNWVSFTYSEFSNFEFVFGSTGTNGSSNVRGTSFAFDFLFCQNDTDNDGIVNYLDLDSDGDGCNDVLEAGHADGDGDGMLGSAPVSVDEDGRVTGTGDGYTGTDTKVTDNTVVADPCAAPASINPLMRIRVKSQ